MTAYDDKVKAELISIIVPIFANKGFDIDLIEHVDLVDDLGMDSLTFISMIVEIEVYFGITVPNELLLMDNFKSVDDFMKIIVDEKLKLNGAEVIANV